jgi:Spy/CpxP family protein refolding chaperone
MTTRKAHRFPVRLVLTGVVLAAVAQAGYALQPEPQMMFESGVSAAPIAAMAGGAPMFDAARLHGGRPDGARGEPPLVPPFIRLSGEQQDKVFELRHAQEPAQRAQMKELRSAHAQLATLAMADAYDEASARQVIARVSQASGELALMHARLQHAAYRLLTPEQRKQLEQCKPGADGTPPAECVGPPR